MSTNLKRNKWTSEDWSNMIKNLLENFVPEEPIKPMDKETAQLVSDCLAVSLILRKVLQHFDTTELLKLSLVSKLWSFEAWSLLRDRGAVTTTVNKLWSHDLKSMLKDPFAVPTAVTTNNCQDLIAFASHLQQTKVITKVHPFSGLNILLGESNCKHKVVSEETSSTPQLDRGCQDIVDQLTWKHLSVKFNWHWTEQQRINCPAFLLVKKILEQFGSVLEELSLVLPPKRGDFIEQFIQRCCSGFPRLQILKIDDSWSKSANEGYTSLIKSLVSRAPNLKVLHTNGDVNLRANLLEGSSAVHVTDYSVPTFMNDEIPEDATPPRMTKMQLIQVRQDFQLNRFNRIMPRLLEASRTTLSTMWIDAIFLVPLTTYGICLENVTFTEIYLEHRKLEFMHPDALWLVKYFDFTGIFPKLEEVGLECSSEYNVRRDEVDDMIWEANAAFRGPEPDRAMNIDRLKVRNSRKLKDSTGRFLVEMFPNVESLSITGTKFPFRRVWESLHDLQWIDVSEARTGRWVKNLDSVFCGIFPQEVAHLREQDEEYLKAVHIVPARPSITCLKRLRSLNFVISGAVHVPVESASDETYLFSKVTALIAFQRCPKLNINLYTADTRVLQALNHLRPHVNIYFNGKQSFSA